MGDADGGRAALEQKRRKVEAKLAEIVGIQHQLCFTVYDYQEGRSGPQLDRKLNEGLIKSLEELEQLSRDLDIVIPVDVLSHIDQGLNPNLFTRSFLEGTVSQTQLTSGKITMFSELQNALMAELEPLFPEEIAERTRNGSVKQED